MSSGYKTLWTAFLTLACLCSFLNPGHAEDISSQKTRLRILLSLSPEAIGVLEQRALSGNGAAMALLGEAYALSFGGLHQDDAMAANWLTKAVQSGQDWAAPEAAYLEFRASHSSQIAAAAGVLSRAQMAVDKKEASNEAADPDLVHMAQAGLVDAQLVLGKQLETGYGSRLDLQSSAQWYAQAAENGSAAAHSALGHAFSQGIGVIRDPEAAFVHYRSAAQMGDIDGQAALGAIYAHGSPGVVLPDPVEALKWLALAASRGNSLAKEAFATLAVMSGADVTRTALERAADWSALSQNTVPG